MSITLYVSNFPRDLAEEELFALFVTVGSVESLKKISLAPESTMPEAVLVEVADEDTAHRMQKELNGQQVGNLRLAVTRVGKPPKLIPSPELEEFTQATVQKLDENEKYAARQVREIVYYCGREFTQVILEETEEIQASGGMLTVDGQRQRTIGGVFFYLARGRMAPSIRKVVFYARPKKQPAANPSQPSASSKKPPKPKAAPAPPEIMPKTPAVRVSGDPEEQMAQLQGALSEAEAHLQAVRARAAGQGGGTYTAIKSVLDIKKQISELLKQYPDLK